LTFDAAVGFVLSHEGGYSNDAHDPGGETRYGISKRAYPDEDIAGLTVERARAIYRADYWDRCKCDALPGPVALLVFDSAVNQGATTAIQMLQRAVGVVADGIIGPVTLAAVSAQNGRELVVHVAAERGYRYGRTGTFQRFGRGWMRRLMGCLAEALSADDQQVRENT
jgi:lysozyme family protein